MSGVDVIFREYLWGFPFKFLSCVGYQMINTKNIYGVFLLNLQRALNHDMPRLDFFSCLRESNLDFLNRTGFFYTHHSPINMPPDVIVLPPV